MLKAWTKAAVGMLLTLSTLYVLLPLLQQNGGFMVLKHSEALTADSGDLAYQSKGYMGPVEFKPLVNARSIQRGWQEWLDFVKIGRRKASWEDFRKIGADPQIVGPVIDALGGPAKLCAMIVAERLPQESHLFHVDVECAGHNKCAVVVMAVDHGTAPAALHVEVLPRSHLLSEKAVAEMDEASPGDPTSPHFGAPVLANATDAAVGYWRDRLQRVAGRYSPGARFLRLPLRTSEYLLLDGRTWHGSWNLDTEKKVTIVMVYVPLDSEFRKPLDYKWPYRFDGEDLECLPLKS